MSRLSAFGGGGRRVVDFKKDLQIEKVSTSAGELGAVDYEDYEFGRRPVSSIDIRRVVNSPMRMCGKIDTVEDWSLKERDDLRVWKKVKLNGV
ncbi:hypothetical protein Tco_0906237 [Tanacetum coccineum]